jgi:hypothetical protein
MSDDEQVATALRAAADAVRPPVEDLVRGGRQRGERRRRRRNAAGAGVAAGLVAVVAVGVTVGPRLGGPHSPVAPAAAGPSPTGSCALSMQDTPLPAWATTGFSDPAAPQLHALGADGRITAIPFGPLSYPESKDKANKVLWVTREQVAAQPLEITVMREGSG